MSKLTEQEILACRQYVKLKTQARDIDKELDVLKPVVREVLVRESKPVETADGKLTLREVKVWEYSPEVQALEDQVALLKRNEEGNGVAVFKIRYDVYCK